MNLNDLHIAVVVADAGSFTAASVRLGFAPSTLSKAIARLERASKVKLFEHAGRGMRPTAFGRAFLERARHIDLAAGDLHAALRDLRQGRSGVLCWGLGMGVPDRWALPLAARQMARGVRWVLSGGMTDSLMRGVAAGELEFALLGLSAPPARPLVWEPLCDDPMEPIAPHGHELLSRSRRPSWAQLARARWIVPSPGTASFAEFERNFAAHGLAAPPPCVASTYSNRELALSATLGAVVLAPRSATELPAVQRDFGRLSPPGGWSSDRRLALVRRADAYLSPAAESAIAQLHELARAGAG
ncbi:LysR family transcriptional regulator [Ottowia sp.]|uniref:LysR family transcriptional regulator n=1 Tax=Ottowia sp. TaxID=1898956 RepID=UPI0039E421C4